MNPRMEAIIGGFQILWVYYGFVDCVATVFAWNVIAVAINCLFGLLQLCEEEDTRTFHLRVVCLQQQGRRGFLAVWPIPQKSMSGQINDVHVFIVKYRCHDN